MTNRWVVNASPLILFAKIERLDLLVRLTTQLAIPQSVADEVRQGPVNDPARRWLERFGVRWVVEDPPFSFSIAGWDLGRGETALLSWQLKRPAWEAVIDDRAARNCARVYGLPYRGSLGVIMAAKRRGLIVSARPIVDQVVDAGLRISPQLIQKALILIGE